MSTTGEKIREVRHKRNRTLQEVAEAAGTTSTTVSKYESGMIQNIPAAKLNAIAEYLEISPAYLLGFDSDDQSLILSVSEQLMMEDYRKLSPVDQETINILIRRLIETESMQGKHDAVQLTL